MENILEKNTRHGGGTKVQQNFQFYENFEAKENLKISNKRNTVKLKQSLEIKRKIVYLDCTKQCGRIAN